MLDLRTKIVVHTFKISHDFLTDGKTVVEPKILTAAEKIPFNFIFFLKSNTLVQSIKRKGKKGEREEEEGRGQKEG